MSVTESRNGAETQQQARHAGLDLPFGAQSGHSGTTVQHVNSDTLALTTGLRWKANSEMTGKTPNTPPLQAARRWPTATLGNASGLHAVVLIVYAAVGAFALALHYGTVGWESAMGYLLASAMPVVGLIAGIYLYRPRNVAPWLLLALGQALFFVSDVIRSTQEETGGAPFPSVADIPNVAAYPVLAAGLLLFIRSRFPGYRLVPLLDAFLIGIGGALLLWIFGIERFIHDTSVSLVERLVMLAYPIGDVLLVSACAYLVIAGRRAGLWSERLLLVSVSLALASDTLHYVLPEEGPRTFLANSGWILGYVLIGLAALVPSMRIMSDASQVGPRRLRSQRSLVAVALGIVPVFAVAEQLVVGHVDMQVVVVTLIVLLSVVVLYLIDMGGAARVADEHNRFQADILENIQDAVVATDLEGHITFWNDGAAATFGYDSSEMLGATIERVVNTDADTAQGLTRIAGGMNFVGQWPGLTKDGRAIWLSSHAAAMHNAKGDVTGMIGIASDVTEQVASARALARLGTAIDQTSEAVLVVNARGEIEYVNRAFEQVTGYGHDEVIGQNPRLLQSGQQPRSFYNAMWATLAGGHPWVADFTNRRKDGTQYLAATVITPIRDELGQIAGYVAVSRDVTRQRENEEVARRLSRERVLIAETIRDIDSREGPEVIAQAVCDQIITLNDAASSGLFVFEPDGKATPYGFAIGDGQRHALGRVPKRRTDYLREQCAKGPWVEAWQDIPGHPYSEMFARIGVRSIAYAPVRDGVRVIGFLHLSSAQPDAEKVLSSALPALVEFADICGTLIGPKVAETTERSAGRRRLEQIIAKRSFHAVYQPIVDSASSNIVGYEALTRFDDGTAPDLMFAEAARLGMSVELETAAIRAAIEGAAGLPVEAWLNVNCSPLVVIEGDDLEVMLSGARRPIVLEITEHEAVEDYAEFRAMTTKLSPNVRLAVDDAGAGFSSLRHILELRPDFVKLDRGLIAGLEQDEAKQALVAGLHHFARNARFSLIAEGVETADELEVLRSLGVQFLQGNLLGTPQALPIDAAGHKGSEAATVHLDGVDLTH